MAGPGPKKSKLDGAKLCDWFEEGADELVKTIRSLDPDDVCPNFNPGSPSAVRWWIRRQLHETTVHRWDVESAYRATTPIDPPVALDGIDEFLDTFVRTRGKHLLDATAVIETTRPKRRWALTPAAKPGRIDVAADRPPADDTSVTLIKGRPESLLLALWGRLSVADAKLTINGGANLTTLLKGTASSDS